VELLEIAVSNEGQPQIRSNFSETELLLVINAFPCPGLIGSIPLPVKRGMLVLFDKGDEEL
jgi:hypothetical protein